VVGNRQRRLLPSVLLDPVLKVQLAQFGNKMKERAQSLNKEEVEVFLSSDDLSVYGEKPEYI
jgi:ABC-type polysaccharide/polyol phosphate transport system ATPase subunit